MNDLFRNSEVIAGIAAVLSAVAVHFGVLTPEQAKGVIPSLVTYTLLRVSSKLQKKYIKPSAPADTTGGS